MNPENWRKVKEILAEALEIAPADRSEFVNKVCGVDAELKSEVESLLEFENTQANLLDDSAFIVMTKDEFEDNLSSFDGKQIGKYKIIHPIGAGGMGAVFLAERADGEFTQKVALKLIKRGMNSAQVLRRFFNERQILASLEHPNIAHLIDGGTTDENLPFLVMEYVEGATIIEYATSGNLDLEAKLNLFREVCAAVSFAHRNLIIHRDLKPSNILVNGDGEPKLLDFGIAKLHNPESNGETATQNFIFTPECASPEQVRGEKLTTATDVYSLGAILYELLTGVRPYRTESKSIGEIIKAVCETEPARPSSIIGRLSPNKNGVVTDENKGQKTTDVGQNSNSKFKTQNSKSLKGDLDNIILKALRKEPERRYSSVEKFSEDIRRYSEGLTVTATCDTWNYRTQKFFKRNRLSVTASFLVLLTLFGGLGATLYQYNKAQRRFNDVRTIANSFIFEINQQISESPIKARELLVKRAVEYLDKLAEEAERDEVLAAELAAGYEKIGDIQAEYFGSSVGDTSGAIQNHQKARTIRERLLKSSPENLTYALALASSQMKIADLSVTVGRMENALENYQKTIELIEKISLKDPSAQTVKVELARAYAKFGQGVLRSGSLSKSLEYFEKASAIMKELSDENPSNVKFSRSFSAYESYTGYAKLEMGQSENALRHFTEAQNIEAKLSRTEPENVENQRKFMIAEIWLGVALRHLHRFEESANHLQNAVKIQQKIYKADESNVGEINALADCHLEIGWMFSEAGKTSEAIREFEKALVFYEQVAKADAENLSALRQISFTQLRLGEAFAKQKNSSAATENYEKALKESEIINRKDAKNSEFRHDNAVCHLHLAEQKVNSKENLKQAIEILEKLVAESPEHRQRQIDLEIAKNLATKLP